MKNKSTNHSRRLLSYILPLFLLFAALLWSNSNLGQTKNFATTATVISDDQRAYSCGFLNLDICRESTVQNKEHAVSSLETDSSRLYASPGGILGLGAYQAELELQFAAPLAADTWSYVKIRGNSNLFNALLGGSLGNGLSNLLGAVLLGRQEIRIEAWSGNSDVVLSRTSAQGFSTDRVRLVMDKDRNYYLAIRPSGSYDRLRIRNRSISALGLGAEYTLDVFHAFTFTSSGNDCGKPVFTSFDGTTGLNLSVLPTDQTTLGQAIDESTGTYSVLKSSALLNLSVASSLSQYFYFPTRSTATHTANIRLSLGTGSLVNVNVLGAVEAIFWDGNTIVYRKSLQDGLLGNTNVLNLLQNGEPATITFAPGRAFDRIEVRSNALIAADVSSSDVRIYDVARYSGASGCLNPNVIIPASTSQPFESPGCATSLVDFDNVDFASNAVDGNNESFASVYASSGTVLSSAARTGFIELNLGQQVPANKTTYVRINYEKEILDRLVGGSLGKLVADLAGGLLLGNQFFDIQAANGGTSVLQSSSSDAFANTGNNGAVTLVQDNIGRYYLAITPATAYNSIRITNRVLSVIGTGVVRRLDVYGACFELGTNACFPANFTSYEGGGVSLSLAQLNQAAVVNPFRAISSNSSEYSSVSLGLAGVAANVAQTIYFSKPSEVNDKVKIRLMVEPTSTLSLDVIGRYYVQFYNGQTAVGTSYTLQQGLLNNIDLLGLFRSGGVATLEFMPSGTFDRVKIGIQSIVSLNVAAPTLRIYNVSRYGDTCPETATASPFVAPVCADKLVSASNADDVPHLFDANFDSYATLKSGSGTLLGLGNQYEGHVELGYDNVVPAGKTSYIRIDFDENVLRALLGGSLGNVVTGLLNGLTLGNHFFEVDVKMNTYDGQGGVLSSTSIATGSSNNANQGGSNAIRIVRDKLGRYYIAVTPDQPYNAVRVTDRTNSVLGLLAQPNTMHVYSMCYEGSVDECLAPFATSFEYTGLSLSVNQLSGAGVDNPHYVLDDNTTNYAEISNGTLAVGASTKQWIFFNTLSGADHTTVLKMRTEGGAINLNLLGALEIKAYNGNTEVATLQWQNGIVNGVNVLSLISSNAGVEIPFSPGVPYDRISVGVRAIVGASVFPPVHLYSVNRECTDVSRTFAAWKSYVVNSNPVLTTVKGDEEIRYTIHVRNTGSVDINDFIITDAVPTYTTYVVGSGGAYDSGTNTVTFSDVDVAVGEIKTWSFAVKVNKDLSNVSNISNVAFVKADLTESGQGTVPAEDNMNPAVGPDTGVPAGTPTLVAVESIHDVSIELSAVSNGSNTGQAALGNNLTYTITVVNTGNADLTGLTVGALVPAGTTHSSGGTFNGGTAVSFPVFDLSVGETVTFTYIVTVEDVASIATIDNTATLVYTDVDGNPETKEAENSMPTNCTTIEAGNILIPVVGPICLGEELVLSATVPLYSAAENILAWYSSYENGVVSGLLGRGSSITVLPTQAVTQTYFVVVEGAGFCFNNPPQMVSVEVEAVPAKPTISSTGSLAVCAGETVILTTTSQNALTYRWYKDGDLISGENGNSIVIDESGDYTVIGVNTSCESVVSEAIAVIVNPRSTAADITLNNTNFTICEGEQVVVTASSSTVLGPVFNWYADVTLTDLIYTGPTLTISPESSTTLYVTVSGTGVCTGTGLPVQVQVNDRPTLMLSGGTVYTVMAGDSFVLPVATATTGTDVIWYAPNGSPVLNPATLITFDESGVYAYTVVATGGNGCSVSQTVVVTVVDDEGCPPVTERIYAMASESVGSIVTGTVSNRGNAIDGNPKTYSTITTGLGVLGVGTTWQNIFFVDPASAPLVPAGTPLTVKLGKEYSGLVVAGGVSVVGLDENGEPIGVSQAVQGGLLDVLTAENVIEFTFVPSQNGPKAYSGVRIIQSSLLSVAQNLRIYGAYYTQQEGSACTPIDNNTQAYILDVLHGVRDLGLSGVSATAAVQNPWQAVDNDLETFAQISRGAALLNEAFIRPIFKSQSLPTDSVRLVTSVQGNPLLSLALIEGYTIQRYLGETEVGAPLDHNSILLNLQLLGPLGNNNTQLNIVIRPTGEVFDRVEIAYGNAVGILGNTTNIYDVSLVPRVHPGTDPSAVIELCQQSALNLFDDGCTTFDVYDSDNNLLTALSGVSFQLPAALVVGQEYRFTVQPKRFGCAIGHPNMITVQLLETPTITQQPQSITVAAGTTANFSVEVAPLATGSVTYQWEEINENNEWVEINGATSDVLNISVDGLTPSGVYGQYRVVVLSGDGCSVISEIATLTVIQDYGWDEEDAVVKVGQNNNGSAVAGSDYIYTVTLTNSGPSTIAAGTVLYLQDVLSSGQSFDGAITSNNGTAGTPANNGQFTLTVATVVIPGDSIMLTVPVQVSGSITADIINNRINIWSTDPGIDLEDPEGTGVTPDIPVLRDYGWDEEDAVVKVGQNNNGSAVAGSDYIYTVTLTNSGPSTIAAGTVLYLQDILSAGQTLGTITSNNGTVGTPASNGQFTLTVATVVIPGDSIMLTVPVQVSGSITADIINNRINIWSTDPGSDLEDPEGTGVTPDIPVLRDYGWDEEDAVVKVGQNNNGSAVAGSDYIYTVTLTNSGPSTIAAGTVLYLQDILSAGQTLGTITSNNGTVGTPASNGQFTLTVATVVVPGDSIMLTVPVQVSGSITADIINNRINIWSTDPGIDLEDPEGTGVTPDIPVVRDYGWDEPGAVVKVGQNNNGSAVAGSDYIYTVTLTNSGPSTIAAGTVLYLQDVLSAGQSFDGAITSNNGTVGTPASNGQFTLTVATVVIPGDSIMLTVPVQVSGSITADIINNRINIWSTDPGIDLEDPEGTGVTPDIPVLRDYGWDEDDAVVKVGQNNNGSAVAGSDYIYTVTLTNSGPSTIAAGTVLYLQDVLSAGQSFDGAITSNNGTVGTPASNGQFTLTVATVVVPGDSIMLTVPVQVSGSITADIINNRINIWSMDPGSDLDDPEGTGVTPDIPVLRDYGWDEDDAVVKVGQNNNEDAVAGSDYIYTVTLTNSGPSTIAAGTVLYLQDVLSAGQSFDGAITSNNGTVGTPASNGQFTLTVATVVVPGDSIMLTVPVQVSGSITADIINNRINIWSTDPGIDLEDPEGTGVTPDIPVLRDYGWDEDDAVVKVGQNNNEDAVAGSDYIYTVTLTNSGPSTIAAGTVLYLQDVLSAGQTLGSITSNNGAVGGVSANGQFTLTVATVVVPGDSIMLTVPVQVSGSITADIINNRINIWSTDPGSDLEDPEGTGVTPDIPVLRDYGWDEDDAVVKVGQNNNGPAVAGSDYIYTVTLTNSGPSTIAAGTVLYLQDVLSAGQSFDGAITSNNGTVGTPASNGQFTLTVGTAVALDGTIVLTVPVTVSGSITADIINNRINIWSTDPGSDLEDPEGTGVTPDIPVVRDYGWDEPGAVVKVGQNNNEAAVAGSDYIYTVTLTNKGLTTVPSGTVLYLQDVLSAGQTLGTITSNNGTVGVPASNGKFTLTVGTAVTPNGTVVLTVPVAVSSEIAVDVINNEIRIWEQDPGTDLSDPDNRDITVDIPVIRDYGWDDPDAVVKVGQNNNEGAVVGDDYAYTITLRNKGTSTILSGTVLYLQDILSAGQSFDGPITSSNGTVGTVAENGRFNLTIGAAIAPEGTVVLTVPVSVSADIVSNVINNEIKIWTDDPETELSDPDGSDKTDDIPVERFLIQAIDDHAEVDANDQVTIAVLDNDVDAAWEIMPNSLVIVDQPQNGSVTIDLNGKVTYTPNDGYAGEDVFTYRVQDEIGRFSNVASVWITVIPNVLKIPNVITPNGDGKNDRFEIVGTENFDRIELVVINTTGNEVYNSRDYQGTWDGRGLNGGTYFYIVRGLKGNNVTELKGWLLIIK